MATVTVLPETDTIALASLRPLGRFRNNLEPVGTLMSRSRVIALPLTALTRPPLALPASIGSATAITCPGLGTPPSKPTWNTALRVCSRSDNSAQLPARCACPRLVHPNAATCNSLTPISPIASSSKIGSLSVSNPSAGLSHETTASECLSRARVPAYFMAPSFKI